MNKQIEELALKVARSMNRDPSCNELGAISDDEATEFATRFLAELTKQEPVATVIGGTTNTGYVLCKFASRDNLPIGSELYSAPIPQADLVAGVERLEAERDYHLMSAKSVYVECTELRQQLSAAQADNDALVKALEELSNWLVCSCITDAEDMAQSFPYMGELVEKAIASHKARQGKERKNRER